MKKDAVCVLIVVFLRVLLVGSKNGKNDQIRGLGGAEEEGGQRKNTHGASLMAGWADGAMHASGTGCPRLLPFGRVNFLQQTKA